MEQVTDKMVARVNRAELYRALNAHEKKAAELRSQLGLHVREKFETIEPKDVKLDGVSRMRTDQITKLHEQGKLSQDAYAAAQKFRQVWEAMSRGLFPGASSIDGMVGTKSRGTFRHPLERMTSRDLWIWFQEYKPWANGPGAKPMIDVTIAQMQRFRCSGVQLCYAVIVDNFGPAQLELKWPVPKGKAIVTKALQRALGHWKHVDYDSRIDIERMRSDEINKAKLTMTDVLKA